LDGLKRLEYRGYDSAGIAILDEGNITTHKAVGKVASLETKLQSHKSAGKSGIAHTRWATHGAPTEANAHPHSDCLGNISIVHNGIIENYQELREGLKHRGHKFSSETDTEVIAHLIEDCYTGDLTKAVAEVLPVLRGTFGLVVMDSREPHKLVVAKRGSPLVVGIKDDECIVASDVSAILKHTKQVVYLDDGDLAELTAEGLRVFDYDLADMERKTEEVLWDLAMTEKQGFGHFMEKEIFEQPESLKNTLLGRLKSVEGEAVLGGMSEIAKKMREINKIIIVACGTAHKAGQVGEYMLEEFAGIPVEVEMASEFRYRNPIIDERTAVLAISQSGETADTLAALKEAKERGALTLGIVNTVGSSIARLVDAGMYNHIGPEVAVASTKAFTSQLALLALLTVKLGRQRSLSHSAARQILSELEVLPQKIEAVLAQKEVIKAIAEKYSTFKHFAYLGRKYNYPIAQEGAIKLKEISYIHAEGFAAGEMKHGPIAMIDPDFPTLYLIPHDSVYEKNVSNMMELKARGGKVIAVATAGDEQIAELADDVIYVPETLEMLSPILTVIPLQMFAYYAAVARGNDVDRPRNLAKSVTVE
jgi:glucosamine--fructose-6-phosphate aminotransferase (isomerizing)